MIGLIVRLVRSENDEQKTVVGWLNAHNIPVIKIHNEGKRSPWAANKLIGLGLHPGASDLFIAQAAKGYHGLWIEMKSKTGKLSVTQKYFIERMRKQGYAAETFWGEADAINYLENFYNI